MIHIKKRLFSSVLRIFKCEKMAYFRCVWSGHTGFFQRIYSKAFDFLNPNALDKESKTGFNATFI